MLLTIHQAASLHSTHEEMVIFTTQRYLTFTNDDTRRNQQFGGALHRVNVTHLSETFLSSFLLLQRNFTLYDSLFCYYNSLLYNLLHYLNIYSKMAAGKTRLGLQKPFKYMSYLCQYTVPGIYIEFNFTHVLLPSPVRRLSRHARCTYVM